MDILLGKVCLSMYLRRVILIFRTGDAAGNELCDKVSRYLYSTLGLPLRFF